MANYGSIFHNFMIPFVPKSFKASKQTVAAIQPTIHLKELAVAPKK